MEKSQRQSNNHWRRYAACGSLMLLSGCVGVRTADEKIARQNLHSIETEYRPGGERPALPTLTTLSPMNDFLLFAMLNQPEIEAAYYDWAAAVERITVERSLPDPQLTFQADIADIVMSLMPGLMMDFPGPGKRKAAAGIASAESDAKYYVFEWRVLQAAFALKSACYKLNSLDAKISLTHETLRLLGQLEKLALIQHEVGKVTLQDVLRAQIEQEQLSTELANLDDSREPLLAEFKASLGLKTDAAVPPVPQMTETEPLDLTAELLFANALARNPRLKAMEAEVRIAEASLRLARKSSVPDFTVGIEVEVNTESEKPASAPMSAAPMSDSEPSQPAPEPAMPKTPQVIARPSFGISLPIWRDKIAAEIAGAQAGKRAVEARLSAEEIALAVEFAEQSFMFREASRILQLLHERLLTMARHSLEVAQSGYIGGKVDFLDVIDAERSLLDFQLSEIEARLQRDLALAELSLLILGTAPIDAPVLRPIAALDKDEHP